MRLRNDQIAHRRLHILQTDGTYLTLCLRDYVGWSQLVQNISINFIDAQRFLNYSLDSLVYFVARPISLELRTRADRQRLHRGRVIAFMRPSDLVRAQIECMNDLSRAGNQ